ncbi:MAG TPA: ABC transporter substrate-binding protein, partial [Tepidisphaeraceae bacterium]|nr:ABC transporter substrate-binding protein [Tepidisphaeraceae bacterium]
GKTIAVSFNSDSHVDLLVSLHEAGLDAKSDVKLINIAPNELPSVFQTNQADAVVIREPQLLRLVEKTGGKVVQRWPFRFVAIARKGFLDANPGVAQKVFAALTDGAAYVTANPDEAAAWAGKNLRMDADFIKRVLEQEAAAVGGQPTDLAITPEFRQLLDAWAAKCLEHKLVKNKPEFGYAAVTAAK